jgi:hypothetical protein
MIICASCNRAMRPKKNGVPFVEMADDRPYKLWMADLWECQDCKATVLHVGEAQQPIAQHFEVDFKAKINHYQPKYLAKEWNR